MIKKKLKKISAHRRSLRRRKIKLKKSQQEGEIYNKIEIFVRQLLSTTLQPRSCSLSTIVEGPPLGEKEKSARAVSESIV
jgi:hypothetical protein